MKHRYFSVLSSKVIDVSFSHFTTNVQKIRFKNQTILAKYHQLANMKSSQFKSVCHYNQEANPITIHVLQIFGSECQFSMDA